MKPCINRNLSLCLVAAGLLISQLPVRAVDFHVTTAQDLQNALTLAAANGADDTIYLAAGYYTGNFNFNSAEPNSLTLQAESGVTNNQVTIDGAGMGRTMSLSCSVNAAITVRGITFLRNCGSANNAGLGIATGANVLVDNCRFLSPANTSGMGLVISSGLNATVSGCIVAGTQNGGGVGISISGVPGNVTVQNCVVNTNNNNGSGNNNGGYGGGLFISGAAIITVTGNTFNGNWVNNYGYSTGGGVSCSGATVTLSGNMFNGNWAYGAGGGACCYSSSGTMTLSGNTFKGNSAANGGGACCQSSSGTMTLSGNTFNGNWSDYYYGSAGGGACCQSSSGTITLSVNTFTGNSSSGAYSSYGGGAYCQSSSGTITLSVNTFTGNSSGAYPSAGGGAYCYSPSSTMTLSGNIFADNDCNGSGGGIYCASSTTLTNNTFIANSADGNGGGACCAASGATMTLAGNTVKQNTAWSSGGGFYADSGTVTILDNLVLGNTQTGFGCYGGGVWVRALALDMINNTIFANNALGGGGGAAFQVDGVTEILHVNNNIIWGNTANGSGADVHLAGTGQRKEFLYNDADDMYGVWDLATSDVDIDPQFFDPVNGDYHLRSTSGCVNVGNNGAPSLPTTDLDGGPRIVAGTVDLGCYEFNNGAFHPADTNTNWVISSDEFTAYATAWQNSLGWTNGPNPISANFVTRAGFLLQSGGTYHNDGSAQPTNWKPGAQ
jgi:hypothetical protein